MSVSSSAETSTIADFGALSAALERAGDNLAAGLHSRYLASLNVGSELAVLQSSFVAAGTSAGLLAFEAILTVVLVSASFLLTTSILGTSNGRAWRGLFIALVAAIVGLVLGILLSWLMVSGLAFRTLRLWSAAAAMGCLVLSGAKFLLAPDRPGLVRRSWRLLTLRRDVSIAIGWALAGVALVGTLQLWGAGPGLDEMSRTFVVGLPAYALFVAAVLRHRRIMACVVVGPRPRSEFRSRFAKSWPTVVISLLAVTFVSTQIALTMGAPLPGTAVVMTVLLFIATPHLDAIIETWAERGLAMATIPILGTAARQTARFALLIVTFSMLGIIWAAPLAIGSGFQLRSVARDAIGIALIALVAAFLWNIVGTLVSRATSYERQRLSGVSGASGSPRTRLGTIVPLLSAGGKSGIVAMALVSILVSLGFNVWPLVTGLSVFGLAVGFGCQAIVKDIVSGPFFLIDDSFRFGEHIETAGAKGTVEKISVRSVSLRSAEGSIVTVPYGQIGTIENFSRDWVVQALAFRVAFDTDVELVLKLFNKIGDEMAADPELAFGFLKPFRGTGISDVENGSLVIKAEFTARPGRQSAIRRAALKAVQVEFRESGIQIVAS